MSPRPFPLSRGGPSPRRRCTVPCLVPAGPRRLFGSGKGRTFPVRARPGAGPPAGGARRGGRDRERDLPALDRLLEGDADLGLQVASALGALASAGAAGPGRPAGARAEQVGQDVAEPAREGPGVESTEAARPAGRRKRPATAVVLLA